MSKYDFLNYLFYEKIKVIFATLKLLQVFFFIQAKFKNDLCRKMLKSFSFITVDKIKLR